ncbi:MAG: nucleotidyltransferase family protein [Oscillospiraceae bacterium]|nr:nucleotidyltransferase family protein [Oscillospiraceae bacterium]
MQTQMYNLIKILHAAFFDDAPALEAPDWEALYQLAEEQSIVPLFNEGAGKYEEYESMPEKHRLDISVRSVVLISMQAQKTSGFLAAYDALLGAGLRPLLIKGLICRSAYGELADHRISGDEDIYIPKQDFVKCRDILLQLGYTMKGPELSEEMLGSVQAVSFCSQSLTIEVHINLFGTDSWLGRRCNSFFTNAFDKAVSLNIDGSEGPRTVYTMEPTQNYLFLFLHFYKHFLSIGVGLRQIIDITLFYDMLRNKIELSEVEGILCELRADRLYADALAIGEMLGFSVPTSLSGLDTDVLIDEMTDSGIYGNMDRMNSHYVINAVLNGGSPSKGILQRILPPLSSMQKNFPVLRDYPILYPIAWVRRCLSFINRGDIVLRGKNLPHTLETANKRLELMKKYGIVD